MNEKWYDMRTIIQFVVGTIFGAFFVKTWGDIIGATVLLCIASELESLYRKFVNYAISEIFDEFIYDVFPKIIPFVIVILLTAIGYNLGNMWAILDSTPYSGISKVPSLVTATLFFMASLPLGRIMYNEIN